MSSTSWEDDVITHYVSTQVAGYGRRTGTTQGLHNLVGVITDQKGDYNNSHIIMQGSYKTRSTL
jgi:D-alanyl-D-alanine carboxypeptidase